jgi:hypothetical protein
MKIKVKIKTLILIIFVLTLTFVWGIPTATLSIAYLLEDKSDKDILFFEKYAEYPTTSNIKGGYLYADSLIKSFSKYTIFLTGWGGGEDTSPENMGKAKNILEDVMKEKPKNNKEKEYFIYSYKLLLDMSIATGDVDMLQRWISYGKESADEKLTYTADVYNGFFLHVHGREEEAKKIISKYENKEIADIKLDILKAEVALFDGDYEEVKSIYKKIDNNWMARERGTFGSTGYYDRSFWYDRVLDDFKGNNIIRGTVTFEGVPMPFVEVYVQAADGGYRTGGEGYIGITDENGEFETLGLKDGLYNIGIGLDGSILANKVLQRSTHQYVDLYGKDGEIDFVFRNTLKIKLPEPGQKLEGNEFIVSWDEVKGAAYYTVEPVVFFEPYEKAGGSYRSSAEDINGAGRFIGTSATFNVETLRNQPGGLSFDGEEMILQPNAILGIFLPGAEYPVVVNAYDENNKLITSSLPLRAYYDQMSSITVEGELSEGEKMILRKDYPAAIEYYEGILKENLNDIHALRYLTRIYGMGWKKGEKNISRAYELSMRYGDITGDRKILFRCFQLMDAEEIKKNREIISLTYQQTKDILDDNDYYFLSKYYIALENFEEARETLKKADGITEKLFFLNMYFGDYIEAAENIKSKNFYLSRLASDKIADILNNFEENPPEAADKQIFDEFLLTLIKGIDHEDGKKLYDETVSKISNKDLKLILDEIRLERHWDISY